MLIPVVWVGASSTPDRAAMKKPRIQPYWLIRLGETPAMAEQLGVVDHGPQGEPGAGGVEEQPQPDGHGERPRR